MPNLKARFNSLALAFALAACGAAASGQSKGPDPQSVVKAMADRYASLSSYQDSGVVETVGVAPLTRRSTDVFFKTYFTRPNKLRFEWTDFTPLSSFERSAVWSDGAKAFGFHSFEREKGAQAQQDMALAIAGATGVSHGSAHTVPNLLMGGLGGFMLTDLGKLSLKGQETFEGEDCYVVEGYHPNGEAWQMWIGKRDSLLRKLRTPASGGEFQEEIHRYVRTDAEVPEAIYRPKVAAGRLTDPIPKEKEEDIRRLLELTAPRDRVNQQLNDVLGLLKKSMPQVPEKVWNEVVAELRIDSDTVLQIYVPIYDRYYTAEEVKELIRFYESPLGGKLRMSSGLVEIEAAARGENLGEELIRRVQERLRSKGYKTATD